MIVERDFLTHWKTRMLGTMLASDSAPLFVMGLWAHCEARREDKFSGMSACILAAVCGWRGDPQQFEDAMIACRWIERDGDTVIARGWRERNTRLLKAIENGRLGGRPPKANPQKPNGNPTETQDEPKVNPQEPGKVREGEVSGDERGNPPPSGEDTPEIRVAPSLATVMSAAEKSGVTPEQAEAFFYRHEQRPLAPSGRWTDRDGNEVRNWQSAMKSFAISWQSGSRERAQQSQNNRPQQQRRDANI